jgi:hypothetical protein
LRRLRIKALFVGNSMSNSMSSNHDSGSGGAFEGVARDVVSDGGCGRWLFPLLDKATASFILSADQETPHQDPSPRTTSTEGHAGTICASAISGRSKGPSAEHVRAIAETIEEMPPTPTTTPQHATISSLPTPILVGQGSPEFVRSIGAAAIHDLALMPWLCDDEEAMSCFRKARSFLWKHQPCAPIVVVGGDLTVFPSF